MARHAPLLFTVLAVLAVAAASASAYVRAVENDDMLIIRGAGDDDRLVGDEEDEFGLGGVISRRRMQDVNDTGLDGNDTSVDDGNSTGTTTVGYISYGALRADSVPCDQRGASYYNCRPGAEANPYTRGCSAITQCRG
ncbi:hypothetical protein QOZ80_7AG0581330 [Eleusine coracana subsp. coracana]|nr:hypothetical protein QOZ80_7AG0581330 [Eleusine coracana subsp. coracana]